MMDDTSMDEKYIISWQTIPRCISMDIGGSLIKIAYVSNKEEKSMQKKIYLKTFEVHEIEAALSYLLDQCYITDNDSVVLTGVMSSKHQKHICKALNTKATIITEMQCFVKAFMVLSEEDHFCYPISEEVLEYVRITTEERREMIRKLSKCHSEATKGQQFTKARDPATAGEDSWPCGMLCVGSGVMLLKINADGSYEIKDGSSIGGATMMGLGRVVTGLQSFPELLKLAEVGSSEGVDIMGKDLKNADNDDVHSALPDGMLMYSFGKAKVDDRDYFSKEDLSRGVFSLVVQNTAMLAHLGAQAYDLKRMFVSGSLPDSSQLFRDELAKLYMTKNSKTKDREMLFIKNGGYLGALGGLFLPPNRPV